MMYSGLPPKQRAVVKTTLISAWALSGLAGASAVIASPNTIISEIGLWGTVLSGALLMLATLIAIVGVAGNRYHLEWIASWGAATALAPYLVTVWALVFTDTATRSTQAFLITSLVAFYISRAALCAAHAAKLRQDHTLSTATLNTITEGEKADDRGDGTGG
ncbi:hypothetical protein QDA00_gp69 [Microbacterium phage Matzah]|uniref:Uncharacterized protein n=1 Tax=Microbacterium phage Matzah TaxID=2686228 RepID=A0A6B9LGY7_9CAUD|nr:hypothetical protein QDA00_gp69 [Microbacterium phage Matzah]QHB37034.1 hypothetical protein SEA_MATZAH_41 [Microbacterium phage Matzah]